MSICIIPGDNHSADQFYVQSGTTYSIPLCGFHANRQDTLAESYVIAREIAEKESQWIVWEETRDGEITATVKHSARAAKMAYGKIERARGNTLKTYGWAYANAAYPNERVAAGMDPFPRINVPL